MFLKSIIHEFDALFWDEDLSDAGPEDYEECDPDFDDEDFDLDGEDAEDESGADAAEVEPPAEPREPIWSMSLELNDRNFKDITFCNQMHSEPQELFWSLMEYFEDEFDNKDFDENEDDGEEK
jgi:hypothetical protein